MFQKLKLRKKLQGDPPKGRDWQILTLVLFGTGLLIMTTLFGDEKSKFAELDPDLNGELVWAVFAADHTFCAGGIKTLQENENKRAAISAARGKFSPAVDVERLIEDDYKSKTNTQLINAYGASLAHRTSTSWNNKTTLSVALECELSRRGLTQS